MKKLVVLEPLGVSHSQLAEAFDQLKQVMPDPLEVQTYPDRAEDPEALIQRCADAHIVVLSNIPFPKAVIDHCPRLELIAVAFTGTDHIDLAACKERNIAVANAVGYSTQSVTELVFGLIIDLLRHLSQADKASRAGQTRAGLIGRELHGKTVGIIGTGAIGTAVAKLALAFGCRVIAFSRTQRAEVAQLGVQYTTLDDVLANSDIVSVHVPLTDETRGLLDRGRLSLMGAHSLLINCARGPIVDNEALSDLLVHGQIGGAGIDVFETEPPLPPDHPLLGAPHTLLAPHVAFATEEAFERRLEIVVDNIAHYLKGDPINLVG